MSRRIKFDYTFNIKEIFIQILIFDIIHQTILYFNHRMAHSKNSRNNKAHLIHHKKLHLFILTSINGHWTDIVFPFFVNICIGNFL